MVEFGKTVLYKTNGERKVIEGKLHALMTAHPVVSFVVGVVLGFVVARLV